MLRSEYEELYNFQGSLCALCRRAPKVGGRLLVDRESETGDVRGLLCGACRSLLGHARDKVSFFRRCAGYLGLPPYAAMKQGWAEWYKDE